MVLVASVFYKLLLYAIHNTIISDWSSTGSLAVSQYILALAFWLLIGGNLERWSLHLTRQHHKLMNILFFEDYITYRPFFFFLIRGTSEEYAYLCVQRFSANMLQTPFRKSTCNELVNANEHFLSEVPTTCQILHPT